MPFFPAPTQKKKVVWQRETNYFPLIAQEGVMGHNFDRLVTRMKHNSSMDGVISTKLAGLMHHSLGFITQFHGGSKTKGVHG